MLSSCMYPDNRDILAGYREEEQGNEQGTIGHYELMVKRSSNRRLIKKSFPSHTKHILKVAYL